MRYIAMLRRNGAKHQITIGRVTFNDNGPQLIEIDGEGERDAVLSAAKAKYPELGEVCVLVSEEELGGKSADEYLAATAPKPVPKEERRRAKAKAEKEEKPEPAAHFGRRGRSRE